MTKKLWHKTRQKKENIGDRSSKQEEQVLRKNNEFSRHLISIHEPTFPLTLKENEEFSLFSLHPSSLEAIWKRLTMRGQGKKATFLTF